VSNAILSIVVDKREPDWVRDLDFGVPTANNVILDAGDLWAATSDSQMLVVERKTVSDLLGSISDGRLFNQVARMRELSPWCYVVICGALIWEQSTGKIIVDYKTTGWDMSAVCGALLTIQELGVGVIFCANDDDFVPCVERLAKRDRGEARIHPVRQPHILSAGETLLASLPGIGYEKVKALLDFCNTPAWALNYLTTLGKDGVPGIGDGIKRAVRHTLELEDGWELWPIKDEDEKNS